MTSVSPAADRNKSLIFTALEPFLPNGAKILELASGTGQHAAYISALRPDISWQPSDVNPEALTSISAYRLESGLSNFFEPIFLDAMSSAEHPALGTFDCLVSINMIHIAPWEACIGLLQLAAKHLAPAGILYVYGPFFVNGRETAPSNLAFDASLRERNASWGIRALDAVQAEAEKHGFMLLQLFDMPANNYSVVFLKAQDRGDWQL